MVAQAAQGHAAGVALGLLLIAGTGTAQTGQTPTGTTQDRPQPPPRQRPRRLLDEVMMVIDNKVILRSEVMEEFWTRTKDKKLDTRQLALRYQDIKFDRMQQAVRAQAAWSLRGRTPDQIQRIVDMELRRRKEEQIDRFGSLNKMQQEMGLMGRSQFIADRRERDDILYELAKQDMVMRMRDRAALMITPKQLRTHYEKRAPVLRSKASVDLAVVRFVRAGAGETEAAVTARAKAAAAAWRDTAESASDIARKFGGAGKEMPNRQPVQLESFIADFLEGRGAGGEPAGTGQVSEPILHAGALWVLKVVRRQPGNEFRFEDPRVQALLRQELQVEEYKRMERQLHRRDREKVFIWDADRDRRRQ